MRLVEVRIERDEKLAIPHSFVPWELPILQIVHGPEKVIEVRTHSDDRKYPDPTVEFDRLMRRYGIDVDTGEHWAAKAYGSAPRGVRELASAMAEAKAEEKADKQAAARARAATTEIALADI